MRGKQRVNNENWRILKGNWGFALRKRETARRKLAFLLSNYRNTVIKFINHEPHERTRTE
jgi:hypothetical protein